jgi:hypothetical protein
VKYYPTIVLCLVVWLTILIVRTNPGNGFTIQRIFAIAVAAASWFVIGTVVERLRREKQDREDAS